MEGNRLILHLGLHKTGTTFLQKNIFPKLQDVFVVQGKQPLRKALESKSQDRILITDEAISGTLLGGQWEADFRRNILAIRNIFGNPRIIIGFRRHDDLILSIYKQYLQEGGVEDFHYLFNQENTGLIKQEELFFNERIKLLRQHFSDVFVYTKEGLEERFDQFIKSLCSFLDICEHSPSQFHISYQNLGVKTQLQVNLLRKLNRIDRNLNSIAFIPSLNGRLFVKLRITPRNICQGYLKNWKSDTYRLPDEIRKFMDNLYHQDWNTTENQMSF